MGGATGDLARRGVGAKPAAASVLALQRSAGNAAVANLVHQARSTVLARDPTEFKIDDAFPAAPGDRLTRAWTILQKLDRRPPRPGVVGVIEQLIGHPAPQLTASALSRIERMPGTKVKVIGTPAPARDPGQAGGTTLVARYNGQRKQDTGFMAGSEFAEFVNGVPADKRDQVQFTIEIVAMVPKYEHQAKDGKYPGIDYFLETLMHELAIHGEKYIEMITAYRAGRAWSQTFEHTEHREHMFVGDPRYMLLLDQIRNAAVGQESLAGVPAKNLLKGMFAQLRESERVYTAEGMQPFPDRGSPEMLDWAAELMAS